MAVAPEDRDQQDIAPQPQSSQQQGQPAAAEDAPTNEPEAPTSDAAAGSSDEITAQMEREIDAAMSKATNPTTSEAGRTPPIRGPRVVQAGREHRTGRVVSVGPEDLFVEFGPKELGVANRNQWKPEEMPTVGSSLELVVDRFDANEQIFVCSRPGAVQKADWELLEPGQVVEARVTGANKGGLELEIANHRAFMPASLVDVRRIDDLSVFVGEKVRCLVKRVDRSGAGNILLSRREVVAQEMKERKSELKDSLEAGQVVDGTVRKIMEFGAFVDIGGVDGLLHISDLSHERVAKVEDVVKEGDTVRVKILKLDWERNRISLGMKQTAPDPWQAIGESVPVGEVITGRVTKLLEFGAFVEVAPGLEGLVHISELSWKRVATVDSVLKPDQVVKVKVLEVDPSKKRISLSVKQTTEAPANMRKGKEEDHRTEEQIRQETPAQRRMREKSQARGKGDGLKSGLGDVGALGQGLGALSLEKFKGG